MHPKLEEFWEKSGPRFVELLLVGGIRPQSYGVITPKIDHPCGRTGLDQQEFFEYAGLSAYLNGMVAITGKEEGEQFGLKVAAEIESLIKRLDDERNGFQP